MQKRLFSLAVLLICLVVTAMGQVTTSGISGKVVSGGEPAVGATITATHQPSGTVYRAITNVDGRYTIQGMRVGGPYRVELSYIGHKTKTFTEVMLRLGETQNLSCKMEEDAHELQEFVVTGKRGLNATKTGAAQSIDAAAINRIPSTTHSIADVARLNPQISTTNNGAMSFAGMNNRYNSFQIDGAMNNDVFGLTSNGSNGGQAGTQPISMETIDQIQINVAPFDVRQSGFTGGAINAITKSGTNRLHGSAYYYGYNENLIGKHYRMVDGKYSSAYNDQSEYQMGFTIGGPIIKNKLFFFANYEKANQEYPNNFGIGSAGSLVDAAEAKKILDFVRQKAKEQGFEYTGAYSNPTNYTKSDKAGLKLDWNINDFNKFTVRWSLVSAKKLNSTGGQKSINADTYSYPFSSKTHTFIVELQSRLSPMLSNEARASYVRVRDQRKPGQPFPMISVSNVGPNNGVVNLGNERSSMANRLDQDIYTVEDNLTWYHGNHTFIFGTHNEFYRFTNLFIQDKYGSYFFNTPNDLYNGKIYRYRYGVANVDVTGDPNWAPRFGAGQLGFYAQDKWDVTDNFQLTYGLRMDIPLLFDKPVANKPFNDYARTKGWDVRTDQGLSSAPMWSPRVGFRWDINNDRRFILRGGVGLFTGRIPFVWLSNNFTGTGIQLSTYDTRSTSKLNLIYDPNGQKANAEKLKASSNQTLNVFDKKFRFSQTLRLNLGFDFNVLGINWTAEGIFSKTLNDIYYKNLAYEPTGQTLGQVDPSLSFDNRPMFKRVTTGQPYSYVYALYNTNKGYTINLSLKAEKHFDFGLDLSASYTWTKSMTINNGSSSVAQSNWNYNYTYRNSNDPELGNSAFNIPHILKAAAFYNISYGPRKMFTTTIGLIYQAQSGSPYSLYYYGDLNGDSSNGNDLMYIPTDEQINKMKFSPGKKRTAEQCRENFRQWIANDPYMSKHRGEYYKRYADNLPFENHFDLHVAEKIKIGAGKNVHALEISMDIMNIGNLLNKRWGHTFGNNFGNYYSPVGYNNGEFQFDHDADYSTFTYNDFYSRWRGQIGVKYTF